MFAFANPTTFKYFAPFLAFYILLVVLSLVFKIAVRYLAKDKRRVMRKSLGTLAEASFWIGLLGLVYLGARRYNVAFLSMEFLHVLNLIILVIFVWHASKKYLSIKK